MRTMLLGTAAVGLVATLLTAPAHADRVTRCVTKASAKASACPADLASTCTRATATIIGTKCTDQVWTLKLAGREDFK
jgi:hypothetical protein